MKLASQKSTNTVWFHLHKVHRIVKFIKTENRIVISRDWQWIERVECYCFRGIISIWEDKRRMILLVAQQCDLNMLKMVTFISNIMSLYCILFWRLPILLSEIYQCLPWPAGACIIYLHPITSAITFPSLVYLLCPSYTGLSIKPSSYAFGCVCVHVRMCVCDQLLSHVELSATSRAVARQSPLSMRFLRQEHWSGSPLPPAGDFLNPWIKPKFPVLASGFFTIEPLGKPTLCSSHDWFSLQM